MDWTTPLKAQQVDFIQRLNAGSLLCCETQRQHSELTVISGKRLNQLRDFCWEMVKKYKPEDPKLYFINSMKGKLGEEVIKTRLADLITEVDYEKRLGGDGKVDFQLNSTPSVGLQVKARSGKINTVEWLIDSQEIEKNSILACVLIQENVSEAQSEYHLIMAGFLPTSMINKSHNKTAIKIHELLYAGGLYSYLEFLTESVQKSSELTKKLLPQNEKGSEKTLNNQKDNYVDIQKNSLAIDYFSLANACYKNRDYQGAYTNYNQVLQLNINIAEAYLYRGISRYYLFGNVYKAIEDFNNAILINPVNSKFYLIRGYFLSLTGSTYNAINDLTQAIKINPRYDNAYYIRGNIHYKLSNFKRAIEDYSHALLINPRNIKIYFKQGCLLYKIGNKNEAIQDFNTFLKQNPNHAIAYYNRSVARYEVGDTKGAKEDYEQALRMNSNLPKLKMFMHDINVQNVLSNISTSTEDLEPLTLEEYEDEWDKEEEDDDDDDGHTRYCDKRAYDRSIDYAYLNGTEDY